MNNKIIIVEGYLASGKSTFALKLSESLKIPYFVKDTFKIALCENISVNDRNESSRFSAVTFNAMMYAIERLFEVGYPVIIEGNFVPEGVKRIDESNIIREIINKYSCKSLVFKFSSDTKILYRRFIEREKLPERGQVNKMGFEPSYTEFDAWCHNLDKFDVGGKVIKIDTTDFSKVNFEIYIEVARLFIDSKSGTT